LTPPDQPLVERPEPRIRPRRRERGHVERRTDRRPPAPRRPLPPQPAAVTGQGGHPDEGRDLLAREPPELRELGQECRREDRAHARDAPEEVVPLAPRLARPDRFADGPLGLG